MVFSLLFMTMNLQFAVCQDCVSAVTHRSTESHENRQTQEQRTSTMICHKQTHNLSVSVATGDSKETLGRACSARITLKEVGVPLTGVGLAAATDWEPATGMGAVSPATVSPQVSKGENTLSKVCISAISKRDRP